jgi:hypothetical protein
VIRIYGSVLQQRSLVYMKLPHFRNISCAVALLTEAATVRRVERPNAPLLCLQKNLQRCSNNL